VSIAYHCPFPLILVCVSATCNISWFCFLSEWRQSAALRGGEVGLGSPPDPPFAARRGGAAP
jgi:hypothetical protein